MADKKLILVTGGAGFIGSHLCARLARDGHRVISLDNYFTGSKSSHAEGVEYREGHTKDIEKLVPETPDLIYHLGEYSRVEQSVLEPEVVHDLNVLGTQGVLEFWQKRSCKLLYAGSSTKFGDGGAARETSPYASTKAANTEKVRKLGDDRGLPYAITYFYNVYGPGERAGIYGTVIEAFRQMYMQGAPAAITAPGTQMRNFTHVSDIVEGLVAVGEKGSGDEFGLGNEKSFSILEVARMFGIDTVMLPPRASNRTQSSLDTSKSRALGWRTAHSLEEYIRAFVSSHPKVPSREKRVLVFSTTFFPTAGPAEHALLSLMRQVPDMQFDVITSTFSGKAEAPLLPNVAVYRVGLGRTLDKYLLPILGFYKARELGKKHSYLFSWALMASYAALAGARLKGREGLPLLVTLADQDLSRLSFLKRIALNIVLTRADQVYGISTGQESHASRISRSPLMRRTLGAGDAFANQLRYAYAELMRERAAGKK
jgi:UDP-glucose 4-epimerase